MEKLKAYYQQYEHLAAPFFFIGGFLLDVFTLGRVDDASNIIIFILYLTVSFVVFLMDLKVLNFSHEGHKENHPLRLIHTYQDEIFHFAQGALLSAFTLFFFKSASLSSSLLFMIVMTALLFINELPFIQKLGPLFKAILLSLNLFSFTLVYIPLIIGQVGTLVFLLSCTVYLILVGCVFYLLLRRELTLDFLKKIWLGPSLLLMLFFIFLRLFSLVPPVPLSLETAGIYHGVEKKYPEYVLTYQREWWRFWNSSDEYFRFKPEEKIYFFTRIFAPGGFKDTVYVHWQTYLDGQWKTSDRIPLIISGGRTEGFRGYTYKSNYQAGEWRILVETKSGLEIGRLNFEVAPAVEGQELPIKVITDR